MSLYIKGMKMPKDDVHAFKLITITNNWVDGEIIMLAHDSVTNEFIGEVVEVPEPHGRLVDLDKMIEELWDGNSMEVGKIELRFIPTIIESEEE